MKFLYLTHWKLKRSWETLYLIKISKEYNKLWWWWYWWLWSHNEKRPKTCRCKIVDQTKHKFTTKCTFFSKKSIVYHWEHKKRFYVHWWWIVPGNTICWTFWLHCIVESLININTKTICNCTLLHWRQLLCSVILY